MFEPYLSKQLSQITSHQLIDPVKYCCGYYLLNNLLRLTFTLTGKDYQDQQAMMDMVDFHERKTAPNHRFVSRRATSEDRRRSEGKIP